MKKKQFNFKPTNMQGLHIKKKNSQNTFPYIHNNFIVFNVEENRKNGF